MKTISAFPSLTSCSFYRLFKINPHLSMPIPHLFHYICYRTVMHTRCGETNPWCFFFLPDFYFIYGSFAWAPSHMGGLSVCLHPQKYTVSSFFASYLSGANLVPCSALIFRKRERKKWFTGFIAFRFNQPKQEEAFVTCLQWGKKTSKFRRTGGGKSRGKTNSGFILRLCWCVPLNVSHRRRAVPWNSRTNTNTSHRPSSSRRRRGPFARQALCSWDRTRRCWRRHHSTRRIFGSTTLFLLQGKKKRCAKHHRNTN